MNGFSLGVVIISMVGSGLSALLCIRASLKLTSWAGSPLLRLALIITAVQASLYFFSYWWLLNHPTLGGVWSETVRPVGASSWFIGPWMWFPLALEFHLKGRAKSMKLQAAQMIEEVKSEGNGHDSS